MPKSQAKPLQKGDSNHQTESQAADEFLNGEIHYLKSHYLEAITYYEKVGKDYPLAYLRLGHIYRAGLGVEKDNKQADHWFLKANEQIEWFKRRLDGKPENILDNILDLAVAYDAGSKKADKENACIYYKMAAQLGNREAQYNFGECYRQGIGITSDENTAVFWFRKSAEQGNAQAEFRLGWCYELGFGVAIDKDQAFIWYQKAANKNVANAQFKLFTCYFLGIGVRKDKKEALVWLRKAAAQGQPDAQQVLGHHYRRGEGGVEKDPIQALWWFQQAAAQGHALGQVMLGRSYERGEGTQKDEARAVEWYQKAAHQDLNEAQFRLGMAFLLGSGIDKDVRQAVIWLRRAAEQGYAEAQYQLSRCYELGTGVDKDEQQAAILRQKAADQNYDFPKERSFFSILFDVDLLEIGILAAILVTNFWNRIPLFFQLPHVYASELKETDYFFYSGYEPPQELVPRNTEKKLYSDKIVSACTVNFPEQNPLLWLQIPAIAIGRYRDRMRVLTVEEASDLKGIRKNLQHLKKKSNH